MRDTGDNLFVSVRGRVLINVEALNMTESVGNYVKHRRVPVISPTTYNTYFVPAISGESIAHGFQNILASRANPVCKFCKRGIFLKSTTFDIIKESFGISDIKAWLKETIREEITDENIHEALEKAIVTNCVVEDVGGFMLAEKQLRFKREEEEEEKKEEELTEEEGEKKRGKKKKEKEGLTIGSFRRTSCFSTGYMIPTKEAIESIVIEPQLHTRFVQGMPYNWQQKYQIPYYIELSSAPYTFSFDLDTKYIGKFTFSCRKAGTLIVEDEKERENRIKTSLTSLEDLLVEMMFGAKKTRFLPVIDWESIIIALSDDIWTIPSSLTANYITNTLNKLNNTNKKPKLFVYINPAIFEGTTSYVKKKTEELLNSFYEALEEFRKRLEEKGDSDLVDWNEFKRRKLEEFLERRSNELAESSDLKYISSIQKKYEEAKKELEKKGIKIYESFEECVAEAVNEAKGKISKG